jgi:CheY-like chemotaxis protein
MPDLTGVQVAQRLRSAGHRHHATFLALISAYNDQDDAMLDKLFDARVDKPVSRKDLMALLGRAAQARR